MLRGGHSNCDVANKIQGCSRALSFLSIQTGDDKVFKDRDTSGWLITNRPLWYEYPGSMVQEKSTGVHSDIERQPSLKYSGRERHWLFSVVVASFSITAIYFHQNLVRSNLAIASINYK